MAWPPLQLQLLLIAAATTAAAVSSAKTPDGPAPWPEQFHAVLFTNLTNVSIASTGPPLRLHDLYYDWPRRRNLNLIRHQLSGDPLYDVEWNNGTTFYFDSATCRTQQNPVGVLRPGWLAEGGAVYLGRETTGGIDCHVWGKADFIVYYEDALTGRPVRWNFIDVTGLQQFVMSFEVGVVLEAWKTIPSGRRPHTASWMKQPTGPTRMTTMSFRMVSWTRPGYSASLLELLPPTDHV